MKKIAFVMVWVAAAVIAVACGPKTEKKAEEEYKPAEVAPEKQAAADPVVEGETLVKASDCKTCHHKTNKLIGPAHLDVAKKYAFTKDNVTMLADKIMKGGSGVWGELPMSPHPDITKNDAEKMAQYVLSLDGEKLH